MNLVRWEPFADLRYMMDRAFEDTARPVSLRRGFSELPSVPLDMYQTADDVVVKATIPGINPEDVDITITGDVLTIKGENKVEEEKKDTDYFYRSAGLDPLHALSTCQPISKQTKPMRHLRMGF